MSLLLTNFDATPHITRLPCYRRLVFLSVSRFVDVPSLDLLTKTRHKFLIGAFDMKKSLRNILLAALATVAVSTAQSEVTFTQIAEFDIPEANQGIGVDKHFFYAVDNRVIAKFDKHTGEYVGSWEDEADGPMIHLDSAMIKNGKIYASHSNWRRLPMTSSVEIWDAESMEHIGSHSFGRAGLGSFTWLDYHEGFWWGTFANYDRLGPDGNPYGGKANTTLAKFDENFNILETWIYPEDLLRKFELMSNSGGSWGPDGFLYITGHDLAEVYKVRIPEIGSVIEVIETIPLNIRGQGIAWDRYDCGILYGIIRATNEEEDAGISNKAVAFQSNIPVENCRKNHWHKKEKAKQCKSH